MVDLHSDASVAFDFHGADDGEFDGAIYSEGMIRRYLKIFDDRAIFEEPPLTPLPPCTTLHLIHACVLTLVILARSLSSTSQV